MNLPNTTLITTDAERSLVVQKENGCTELSVLTSISTDDPAHLNIAKYADGSDEPISEIKLCSDEIKAARKLLNDPVSLQILGIDED